MPNPALAQKYREIAGGLLGLAFNYLTVIKGQKIYPTIGCSDDMEAQYLPEEVEVVI